MLCFGTIKIPRQITESKQESKRIEFASKLETTKTSPQGDAFGDTPIREIALSDEKALSVISQPSSFAAMIERIAGINILRIGIIAYQNQVSFLHLCLSILVFLLFHFLVFSKLVKKHTLRILRYPKEQKQYFFLFFDLKSFLIMAFMMTLGITLRVFNLAPTSFIAYFYTGLGVALSLAGVSFGYNFAKTQRHIA